GAVVGLDLERRFAVGRLAEDGQDRRPRALEALGRDLPVALEKDLARARGSTRARAHGDADHARELSTRRGGAVGQVPLVVPVLEELLRVVLRRRLRDRALDVGDARALGREADLVARRLDVLLLLPERDVQEEVLAPEVAGDLGFLLFVADVFEGVA